MYGYLLLAGILGGMIIGCNSGAFDQVFQNAPIVFQLIFEVFTFKLYDLQPPQQVSHGMLSPDLISVSDHLEYQVAIMKNVYKIVVWVSIVLYVAYKVKKRPRKEAKGC